VSRLASGCVGGG